jgi:hypothetical protein
MYAPFNIVVKIVEGERELYVNTEQAIHIEILKKSPSRAIPEVIILMSGGQTYELHGEQAQAFIDRVEGR